MKAIEFNTVWKKFRKGERFNSLRDAIPNLFSRNNHLKDQEFWALQNVSFSIQKGEVTGIIGPNGAGKSTILKLLSRIMVPNKGDMKIRGRVSALIEVAAGFHNDLTGRENAYLNGTILGMRKKEIDRKFDEIVEFSGLAEFIDTPVKRYSSGMYSRLGFSVAAHMDPDILLVDEVLAVGDIAFQAKCAKKMRDLLKLNTTIILVSHNLSLIQSLCKRAILLHKGQILRDGITEDVIPYYQNLIYQQGEEELKKKLSSSQYYVKVNNDPLVTIEEISLYNKEGRKQESFQQGAPFIIKARFETKEAIKRPTFVADIFRADEVLCCSFSSRDGQEPIDTLTGKGTITIDTGALNLASGIYVVKFSIWDSNMIHPFTNTKNCIFIIEASSLNSQKNPVFLAKAQWHCT